MYENQTVKVNPKTDHQLLVAGADFRVESKYEVLSGGQTWREAARAGNWAAHNYANRVQQDGLPDDDNVYYGKVGHLGYLVHESEFVLNGQG